MVVAGRPVVVEDKRASVVGRMGPEEEERKEAVVHRNRSRRRRRRQTYSTRSHGLRWRATPK